MIFSKDVLFVHVPKTGGHALTRYLLDVLPRPVYYRHHDASGLPPLPGVHEVRANAHETLGAASKILMGYGLDVLRLPLILAGIRNPYAREVSRFFYFRKDDPRPVGLGRNSRNQALALACDFERFAVYSDPRWGSGVPYRPYFFLDGALPSNLTIVRTENLEEEVRAALARIGIHTDAPLPWSNETDHEHFSVYYSPRAEEAVFRRYRWAFENGFYERMDTTQLGSKAARTSYRLPLAGPVRQLGVTEGLSPDLRVGGRLRFTIEAQQALRAVVLEGLLARSPDEPFEVRVANGGDGTVARIREKGPFRIRAALSLGKGEEGVVEVRSSKPPAADGGQAGELGFLLRRVTFETAEASSASVPGPAPAADLAGEAEDLIPYVSSLVRDRLPELVPKGSTLVVVGEEAAREREIEGRRLRFLELDGAGGLGPSGNGELLGDRLPDADAVVVTRNAFPALAGALRALDARFQRIWSDGRCIVYGTRGGDG